MSFFTLLQSPKLMMVFSFYSILTFVIFPYIFYTMERNMEGIGKGYVVGSLVSIIMWHFFGKKLAY